MNVLEMVGVLFCVILGAIGTWGILYFLIWDAEGNDTFIGLVASILTIVIGIIVLTIVVISYIKLERENDEYKKVISEYEETNEAENEDSD